MPLPDVTAASESATIAEARRGSADALGALYEAHGGPLLRLATRITGSASDGEDILHDLFVGLPDLLGRYEHRSALGAWLRGVVAKTAIARLRRANRRTELARLNAPAHMGAADPWSALDLERALARLSDDGRTVFVLKQIEGFTHDEIAALLGISSGASRVRHLRAIRQLRAILEPGR